MSISNTGMASKRNLIWRLVTIALPYGWAIRSFLMGDESTGLTIMCASTAVDLLVTSSGLFARRGPEIKDLRDNEWLFAAVWIGGIIVLSMVIQVFVPKVITANTRIMMPIWIGLWFLLVVPEYLLDKKRRQQIDKP